MPFPLRILLYFAVGYIAIATVMFFAQRRLMYLPDRTRPSLERAGVTEMREVTLSTEDGLELLAWFHPPVRDDSPVLLYLHGNGGHIGYRGYKMRPYLDAGYGVLLVSWRGYGGNQGHPTEQGLYQDARAGLLFLSAANIPMSRVVVYGESLGSGPAVQMATEFPVGGVVLEAPFTSIADIAQRRYWYLPARYLIHDRFEILAKIGTIDAPLLILHGELDTVIPIQFGRALLDAAEMPKRGVFFPQGSHNDLYDHGAAEVTRDFIANL